MVEQPEYLDPKRPFACWLLADNTLPFARDASEKNRWLLKCLLKHTLLFNVYSQQLVFSDSQALNNASLRLMLRHDQDVQRLINSQMIAVAIRHDKDGQRSSWQDLRESFKSKGKYLFDAQTYGEGEEFELWDACRVVPYSLADISERYESKVLEMFRSPSVRRVLPKALMRRIHDLAMEERSRLRETGDRLGWIFFHQDLQKHLKEKDWTRHRKTINDVAQAPFHSGLPSLLNADPVYAHEHAAAFELMRGVRQAGRLEQVKLCFDGLLGLAEYQIGIASLEVDDILALLDTDEAAEFGVARDAIDGGRESMDRVAIALREYASVIEDRIIQKQPNLKVAPNRDRQQTTDVTIEEYMQTPHKVAEFVGIFCSWVSAAVFVFDRVIYDRLNERAVRRAVDAEREASARRDIARDELERKWNEEAPEKLDQELIRQQAKNAEDEDEIGERVDLDQIETFYKE